MNQGTILGSQIGRWIILAALVALLGALLLTIRPVFAQATPPGAPTGLTATEVGLTVIELSWTAPTQYTGGAKTQGYRIEFSPDGMNWELSHANTEADSDGQNFGVTGVQTYFADTTPVAVAGGTTRHYRVMAINVSGTGPPSNSAMATTPRVNAEPNEPMAVAAVANGPAEINLTWTRSTTGSPTGYKIEYSKNGNLPWMPVADIGNVNKYSNTGLSPAATRHYRVSAVNGVGRGPHSSLVGQDHVAKTTPKGVPAAPTSLTATAVKADEAELYWTPPTNTGGAPITGYVIEYSTNGLAWLPMQANTEATDPAGQNSARAFPAFRPTSQTSALAWMNWRPPLPWLQEPRGTTGSGRLTTSAQVCFLPLPP